MGVAKIVSNCTSLSVRGTKCVPDISSVDNFDFGQPVSTRHSKIVLCHIFDLYYQTDYLGQDVWHDDMVEFNRIIQHVGLKDASCFEMAKAKDYVRLILGELSRLVQIAEHRPCSMLDFILTCLFKKDVGGDGGAMNSKSSVKSLRLGLSDNGTLEISFMCSNAFEPINPLDLQKFISSSGIQSLIFDLLNHPVGYESKVPGGSRDNKEAIEYDGDEVRADCFKASLLKAPDSVLSPEGKHRVEKVFPNHEITLSQANILLKKSVKTISVRSVKNNIMDTAMNSLEVMIGVFHYNSRKHCILVDGTDGSIYDPVDGTHDRTKRNLTKLGITEFVSLYTLKRVHLSDKTRYRLERDLGLPFVKGPKSIPMDSDGNGLRPCDLFNLKKGKCEASKEDKKRKADSQKPESTSDSTNTKQSLKCIQWVPRPREAKKPE